MQVQCLEFSGSCNLWRIRGYVVVNGNPDLSQEVYVGDWKHREELAQELQALVEQEERLELARRGKLNIPGETT